jgi:hypothetical protein
MAEAQASAKGPCKPSRHQERKMAIFTATVPVVRSITRTHLSPIFSSSPLPLTFSTSSPFSSPSPRSDSLLFSLIQVLVLSGSSCFAGWGSEILQTSANLFRSLKSLSSFMSPPVQKYFKDFYSRNLFFFEKLFFSLSMLFLRVLKLVP